MPMLPIHLETSEAIILFTAIEINLPKLVLFRVNLLFPCTVFAFRFYNISQKLINFPDFPQSFAYRLHIIGSSNKIFLTKLLVRYVLWITERELLQCNM